MPGFVLSLIVVAAVFITGLLFFRKTEKVFADII
jgi:hypothetical protein